MTRRREAVRELEYGSSIVADDSKIGQPTTGKERVFNERWATDRLRRLYLNSKRMLLYPFSSAPWLARTCVCTDV